MLTQQQNKSAIILLILFILSETKKPFTKRLEASWRLECDLGIITDSDCPIDGGWSPWAPWSKCYGACDSVGHRKRLRTCNNPTPSKDGMPCRGFDEQLESCYLTNCSVKDFRNIVEGDPAREEALHQLEAVPLLMERCLQMECPFEAVDATLAIENTWQINSETVWNALQCVKHDIGCPIAGDWGAWGSWSSCGARCGKGTRWRMRRCDTPPPSLSHLICPGTPLQYEQCEGDQCAIDGQYVEQSGSWSEWGAWTESSEKCGYGVRRRKRACVEKQLALSAINWGTHCRGQYDELDVYYNTECVLDGGWSGWGPWGPCSQTCGAGRRSRTRSCTRPIPSGNGTDCVGPKSDVGTCHLAPCEVFTHTISLLNGDSYMHYNFPRKRSTFFHFYIRFMALSPHGIIVRRGSAQNPSVRLSLQKWHVCLDASGLSKSCSLPRMCSTTAIEPATWHSILMSVTSQVAIIRLNDAQISMQNWFPCNPELENDKMNIFIGEKFHGEIHEVMLNFIPLHTIIEREQRMSQSDFYPISTSNMAYEKASPEEAYLLIQNDQYLRLPCFKEQDEWQIELTIKSEKESGTIILLPNNINDNWLYVILQNMRLKIKFARKEFKSEAISSTEFLPDQWMDIVISKKRETNTIVVSINAGERLHVLLIEETKKIGKSRINNKHVLQGQNYNHSFINNNKIVICNDEFFIGGVPLDIKNSISEDFTPFTGIAASVSLNNNLLDLHDFSMERTKNDLIQLSSRTASISGSYHETEWGESNQFNLTCLHARTASLPHSAYWLYWDTQIKIIKSKNARSVDDGRVLRLLVTAEKDLRGYYTCRAHSNRRTRNIVTFGVLGKIQYKSLSPDTLTVIAICTTLSLVIFTLAWLIIEGYHDLRNGYGFFRDAHLSPEEEAEVVCQYFEQNMHLLGSQSEVNLAKTKARRRGKRLASKASFGVQEPDNMLEGNNALEEFTSSDPEGLPTLPEVKNSGIEFFHKIYRYEPSYVSSPRHGSLTTRTKLSSTSSLDSLAKVLGSPSYVRKIANLSKDNKRIKNCRFKKAKNESNLLTIKSSTFLKKSPAHKVLEKFQELKSDD
ncbi:uncharacterized protein LOC116777875 [Danaus plexippus]|uniref:uncharacterized protein LOC116777875 n=1 Tax=Danaus plexippus TaxID=13037 RepID=UPI002AAF4A9A|nr:uncharacterized protein LOC116777875 [Danaus plexippus]